MTECSCLLKLLSDVSEEKIKMFTTVMKKKGMRMVVPSICHFFIFVL